MNQSSYPHLANAITVSRIFGVGLLFWLTPFETNLWLFWTLTVYTLVCLTDFLDGWVARRLHIVTDFGKVLDPLADKILVLVFLPLVQMGAISSFPVFLILAREFIVMGLRVFSAKIGIVIPAGFLGKLKTGVTLPVCGLLFLRVPVRVVDSLPVLFRPLEIFRAWTSQWPPWVFDTLIWGMVGLTLWSMVVYLKHFIWQQLVHQSSGNEQKAKQKMTILIPNIVTFLNLLCGIFAALYAWFGWFHPAVLLVLVGTLLDGLDGRLARRLNAYSDFGASLDSKADFINFGVAPAVVIFSLLSMRGGFWMGVLGLLTGLGYYMAVHFRLKRFNQTGHLDFFEGLPSPIGAGMVVVAAISTYLAPTGVFVGVVVAVSWLMVSRIPYPHLDIFSQKKFLRTLRIPTVIFLVLTILHLLNIHIAKTFFAYEALFGMGLVYVALPLLKYKTEKN